jgi:hypothetical protein
MFPRTGFWFVSAIKHKATQQQDTFGFGFDFGFGLGFDFGFG